MDIKIRNIPRGTRPIDLRDLLKEHLYRFNIRYFDIQIDYTRERKAIITIEEETKAREFLATFGGKHPVQRLFLLEELLEFGHSTHRGQPDPLKVRLLREKRLCQWSASETIDPQSFIKTCTYFKAAERPPVFHIVSLETGLWMRDRLGKLSFDQKYKDARNVGTIIFGQNTLVIYLEKSRHRNSYHGRIDIPYDSIENAITTSSSKHDFLTCTLRTLPKVYEFVGEKNLHLYLGQLSRAPSSKGEISRSPKSHTLLRRCNLSSNVDDNVALCTVYRVSLRHKQQASRLLQFIRRIPTLHRKDCFKTTVPSGRTKSVAFEYEVLEHKLSDFGILKHLDFNL
ncbi:hypothetical protein BDV96DRAFT_133657 [Lophiotrema nucula]|uniref:RdRP-like PH domain-containing protein n=1 Tax=Lophiotrema nucula TaxID=690887 RepID=A0A6A5ZQE3_9PLEO|nr:hypothetical protein BDV96DRAFT_133657 [Lophiotrema nucula]